MSINHYTIIRNGDIFMSMTCSYDTLLLNMAVGDIYVEGMYPSNSYFYKSGEIKELPERPSLQHKFDKDTETWFITEEVARAVVRQSRDERLSACDWTQVPDAPVDQVAWATYRQALRDIPQQTGFPDNITWPIPP